MVEGIAINRRDALGRAGRGGFRHRDTEVTEFFQREDRKGLSQPPRCAGGRGVWGDLGAEVRANSIVNEPELNQS